MTIIWTFIAMVLAYLVLYAMICLEQPFATRLTRSHDLSWNDIWTNALTILAALICAVMASLLWHQNGLSKPGWQTWFYLSTSLYMWMLGEAIWTIYNLTVVEVPPISLADIPWFAGYIFLTLALDQQLSGIFQSSARKRRLAILITWLLVLTISFMITYISAGFKFDTTVVSYFLSTFYACADLVIAIIALLLVIMFRGGAMLRPWLGLFVFALADTLYAWLYESGTYSFTTSEANTASVIADTIYVAAYLIFSISLLMHLLLMKYGPAVLRPIKPRTS